MTRKVFTEAAAMEANRLYSLVDERGNRVHSQMEIAAMLGVSETTVFRALHKRGAYMALPKLKTDEDAAASEARFREAHPELFTATGKMTAAIAKTHETVKQANRTLEEIEARSPLDE